MKKYLVLPFLFLAANCFAKELANYDQVKAAVTAGQSLHIAIDFQKCTTPPRDEFLPNVSLGIFTPNETLITADGDIVTSLLHFTRSPIPGVADEVSYYQYVRYTITSDNNVSLKGKFLSPGTMLPLFTANPTSDQISIDCKIASGARIYSN